MRPVPLVAGRFDRDVGLGDLHLFEQQGQRGRRDRQQDQDRNHRPADFKRRVVCERRGLLVDLGIVPENYDEQQGGHENGDHSDDCQ